jgi:hypothetical protein
MMAFLAELGQAYLFRDQWPGHCLIIFGQYSEDLLRWCLILSFINVFWRFECATDSLQFGHFGADAGKCDGEALWVGKQKRLELVELNIRHKTRVVYFRSEALLKKLNFLHRVNDASRFGNRRKIRWQPEQVNHGREP